MSCISIEHALSNICQISAGDLPTDTSKLESQLFKIFQIARHWDAILLLDEADVFLEERAPKDIHRNGIVSVFLRTMEYCQGIMLLTTNRVTEFDPAALSRIHLKVKYDDLKSHAKSEVWRNFLSRACTSYGKPSISDDELKRLSNTHLNGREVNPLAPDLKEHR
jgi:SpoVK/Ycf46/Vps4 family AAA+-type ATPase